MTLTFPAVLVRIFSYQLELMQRYKTIEQLPDAPVSLHSINGQKIIKDFAWRTTEELTEAYAEYDTSTSGEWRESKRDRCGEELADALHFLVELLIFAGVTPQMCLQSRNYFPEPWEATAAESWHWGFVQQLGLATNQLRNRPWKKTLVPTNEAKFRALLLLAFERMMHIWSSLGFTYLDMLAYYERKREINVQRTETNY